MPWAVEGFLKWPASPSRAQPGPFAYNGIGAFWFPVFVFFGEIVVMIVVSFRVINQQAAKEQALVDAANPAPVAPRPTPVAGA